MRIIIPEAIDLDCWIKKDTIEITDTEWNLIEKGFNDEARVSETYRYCFSRYLRDLISLAGKKE